jgi:hypothetical protein
MPRPKSPVNLEMVTKLATIGCTYPEIAYALDISLDTLIRHPRFATSYKKGDAGGKQSLRHRQFQVAMEGNVGMLIWLGKQRLGQKDAMVTEHAGEVTINDGAKDRLLSKLSGFLPKAEPSEGDQVVN